MFWYWPVVLLSTWHCQLYPPLQTLAWWLQWPRPDTIQYIYQTPNTPATDTRYPQSYKAVLLLTYPSNYCKYWLLQYSEQVLSLFRNIQLIKWSSSVSFVQWRWAGWNGWDDPWPGCPSQPVHACIPPSQYTHISIPSSYKLQYTCIPQLNGIKIRSVLFALDAQIVFCHETNARMYLSFQLDSQHMK